MGLWITENPMEHRKCAVHGTWGYMEFWGYWDRRHQHLGSIIRFGDKMALALVTPTPKNCPTAKP